MMKVEERMNLEMKILSRETIRPSNSTPSHLKTFKLSLVDQLFPSFHIPLLLFYNAPNACTPHLQISSLRSSLSDTLSQFYPLAGRCIDYSTVSCHDQGVPFIQTYVDSCLADLLKSCHKLDLLPHFLPPPESLGPPTELVPLAFQINVFACGGVVLGCYMLHKFIDAASSGTFFRYWAALVSGRYQDAVAPEFDPILKAFPLCPSLDRDMLLDPFKAPPSNSLPIVVAVKCVRFTKESISKLKALATCVAYTNPTSFETVAGFVWENVVAAAHKRLPETTMLSLCVNMWSRTNPPLPKTSMGNCITTVQAKAKRQATLPELVGEIHLAVSKASEKIESFHGENGVEKIIEDHNALSQLMIKHDPSVYHLSSWCNLGLNEADFGLGKPNWIIPTDGKCPPFLRNFMFFTDYCDSNAGGIDVLMYLEETEMQILESNRQFLEFASPN